MIRLTQEFGAHTGRQFSFDQARVRVGRAPSNEIAFDPQLDLDASANHCEVVCEDSVYYVVDLGSRNGTYVNGVRVQKQRISSGDMIECGRGGPRLRAELPNASPVALTGPHAPMPAVNPYGVAPTAAAFPQPGMSGPYAAQPPAPALAAPGYPPAPPGFAPAPPPPMQMPPAASALAPMPFAGPMSPGAAAVAGLPANAQVGKRTVAMMINAALVQAGVKKSNNGLKATLVVVGLLVLGGFGFGGYMLWQQQLDTEDRLDEVGGDGNAGERIARQFEGAIYMLAAVQPSGPTQGFCSGFAVTQDLIATNAHCIDAAQDQVAAGRSIVAMRNNGHGERIPAQPIYRDPRFRNPTAGLEGSGYDVGLVRAQAALPVRAQLASLDDAMRVAPGANIYVYGFPGMTMNEASPVATLTSGVVSRMTDFFDRAADNPAQAQKIQHSAQTTSGSSGSPIFLSSGMVIGVNAGSLADEERQSMIDPATGRRVSVEVNRSSNFKYGMRADLLRLAIQAVGESAQ